VNITADMLADWSVARTVAVRVAGPGPGLSPLDRARLREDFSELVPEAERLVMDFTDLRPAGYPSRPWVMSRSEWLGANIRSLQTVLGPVTEKLVRGQGNPALTTVRRTVLGAEVGALLGYVSRKVLGQFDLFVPPDDDGTIYFVGPNIAGVERRHAFAQRDFRLWISLHEVAHRLQFGAVPWLRPHVSGLMDSYLGSMNLDMKAIVELVRKAAGDVRAGRADWRGTGWITILMSPEQQETFRRMQAVMTLLEGHGNFVMNSVGEGRVRELHRLARTLRQRRQSHAVERAFQRAIGFDQKSRQYDRGEAFVAHAVGRAGMEGFNRVWDGPANLPTLEELARPDEWVARVAAA
jgi:coenzyme F420 biosynthesis associated uncharacterized protein